MVQKARETLVLLLIAVLPFHALLVTVGTKLLDGSGHAPNSLLVLWKEGLLVIIMLLAAGEIIERSTMKRTLRFDLLDWLIVALIILSLLVTAGTHGTWMLYLFGFKYDFVPLVAFLVLRRVPWSEAFKEKVLVLLLITGGLVAAYGMLTFVLPQSAFTSLGYSALHSLYLPDAPLAAFQQVSGMGLRRIQGVMSGANQLGLWLLIPLSVWLMMLMQGQERMEVWRYGGGALFLVALFLTFSRAAWVAAASIFVAAIVLSVPRKQAQRYLVRCSIGAVIIVALAAALFPDLVLRAASSKGHLMKPLRAVHAMIARPLGSGLGAAGPASNRISDACVFLDTGADPSWASDRPDLCVFVGETQVQPLEQACNCPFVTENWYLQIGVELGILGFVLYILLIFVLVKRLMLNFQFSIFNASIGLMFISVSIAGVFLHAWEDSAVAYSVWVLLAAALSDQQKAYATF